MEFHDPISINLARQSQSLVSKISPESPYAAAIVQASLPGPLLDTLSHLLTVPALTLSIATAFRPLLLDLCARWLNDRGNEDDKLVALCLLLDPHQELYP
jgi:midasin